MKRFIYLYIFLLLSSFAFAQPVDEHTSDTVIPPSTISFGALCGLTAASVPFAGAGGCLEEENANFFYTSATDLLTVSNVKALTNFFLLDDNAFFFDTAAIKSLKWDSTNTRFAFNDFLITEKDTGDTIYAGFTVQNTNEGLTGETGQGVRLNLSGTGTSDSGSTYTEEVYGFWLAQKLADFFGAAASETDFDSVVTFGILKDGVETNRIQLSRSQVAVFTSLIVSAQTQATYFVSTTAAAVPAVANYVSIGRDGEYHRGTTYSTFFTSDNFPDPTSSVTVYRHNPFLYSNQLAFNSLSIMTTPKGLWVWNTDPGAGTQADYSGNSHTMTFNGGITTTDLQLAPTGLVYIITLDGTDDYISTPDHADFEFPLTAVSWEFVINVTDQGTDQIIWSKWDETTAAEDREWRIYLENTNEYLITELYDETSNTACTRTTSSGLSVGYHHIVIVYDGGGGGTAADGITIYNNGAVEASAAINNIGGAFVQMRAGSTPVWIGADEGTGGTAELFFQSNIGLFGVTQEPYSSSDDFKLWRNANGFYVF